VGGAAAMALLALAACGGPNPSMTTSPAPSASPVQRTLPPRPAELHLDGINPCSLLIDEQRAQLGVNPGVFGANSHQTPLSGDDCSWTNLPKTPDNAYLGRIILGQGAEYALGLEPLRSVDGFAATTSGSIGSDPTYYCALLVDVAPGQALSAQYSNGRKDYPGINHRLACDKAQELASMMLSTLRAMKQR
jgi:Protein of unknown function (DUF3558)